MRSYLYVDCNTGRLFNSLQRAINPVDIFA
jgi:hypothetical protein